MAAPALLQHVNLLLAAYGGAALATAARLKWDPSTYVALRALLPREFRVLAGALAAAGAALLALPQLAALGAALAARRPRAARACYRAYAGAMAALLCAELALGAWLTRAVAAWLRSAAAAELRDALQLRDQLRPLLRLLARWHPLPEHIDKLIQEASADAPCNAYVALALGVLLALLQPAAVALASAAAWRAPGGAAPSADSRLALARTRTSNSWTSNDSESAPLRTAYKKGRLVIL